MRKALFVVAFAAALWLAPGALASGWCGGRPRRPPIARRRHGRADPRDRRDAGRLAGPVRRRREPAARRRRLDERLVAGPGLRRVPRASTRRSSRAARASTSRSCACRSPRAPTRAHDRLRRDRERAPRPASRPVQGLRRLLRRAVGRAGRLRHRRRRVRPGRGVRDRVAERLSRRARRQRRGARAAARLRRAPGGGAERVHAGDRPGRRADTGHPCDSPSDVLYPYDRRAAAAAAGARLQPRRLLRPQRLVERHPGLDLPAPPEHARGGARVSRSPGRAS